jgi:hypothetical protein
MCRQPWFTPLGRPVGGMTQSGTEHLANGGVRFTLTGDISADATVVIETQTGPGGEVAPGIGYAQDDVPACQVDDAPGRKRPARRPARRRRRFSGRPALRSTPSSLLPGTAGRRSLDQGSQRKGGHRNRVHQRRRLS